MGPDNGSYAYIDKKERLVIPPEMISGYGLKPGSKVYIEANKNGLSLSSPTRLAKLYIEPTNRCNLDCRTCMRNSWDEPLGIMSETVFERIISGLKDAEPTPDVFFGGIGEPLFHPHIIEMVTKVRELGACAELITNGLLLTPEMSRGLINAGLDVLWVSLDGATPESFADIRLGAELPKVLDNIAEYCRLANIGRAISCCNYNPWYKSQLGIEFVAMRRNINDLPAVLTLGKKLGAKHFIVTNVLPYTKEMSNEVLYRSSLGTKPILRYSLPPMDEDKISGTSLKQFIQDVKTKGFEHSYNQLDKCPFIEGGSGAIRWDGGLSPCLPLLHSHTCYIPDDKRVSRHWIIGNVVTNTLSDLWNKPEHLEFRKRVHSFSFPPCTSCGGCELKENNEEDCIGNTFPTCGGCLWAQGIIQCP